MCEVSKRKGTQVRRRIERSPGSRFSSLGFLGRVNIGAAIHPRQTFQPPFTPFSLRPPSSLPFLDVVFFFFSHFLLPGSSRSFPIGTETSPAPTGNPKFFKQIIRNDILRLKHENMKICERLVNTGCTWSLKQKHPTVEECIFCLCRLICYLSTTMIMIIAMIRAGNPIRAYD